jgi:NADH dehydrogenase (ubiquinone) 1 alpha/beta subcomplex 1
MPGIEARVLQLLRDFEKVSKEKVTVDAHFINDLGLDSLDQVEITMGLEVGEVWLIDVRTSSILS